MKSETLVLPHTAAVFVGLALFIGGALISTHRVSGTDCLEPSEEGNSTRKELNRYAFVGGLPAMISGTLACLAGCSGAFGGMKKSRNAVICATVLLVLAGLAALVAFAVAMLGKTISDFVCNSYTCGGDELCVESNCGSGAHPASHVGQGANRNDASVDCSWMCRDDYDVVCDYGAKSVVAGLFCTLMMLITFITSCLDCGAGCCCADSFGMQQEVSLFAHTSASSSSALASQIPPARA